LKSDLLLIFLLLMIICINDVNIFIFYVLLSSFIWTIVNIDWRQFPSSTNFPEIWVFSHIIL